MDILEADRLAKFHVARLLGPQSGWTVRWDQRPDMAGACYHQHRVILLSENAVIRYGALDVEQVILHEIAHAQVGPGKGHGKVWLEAAQRLGYTGDKFAPGPVGSMGNWFPRLLFILGVISFLFPPALVVTIPAAVILTVGFIVEQRSTGSKYAELDDFSEVPA